MRKCDGNKDLIHPMIYDCFPFFNELDILEIRLNVLDSVVDRFVLVEATKTYSNQPKPLYFEENKQRFAQFLHKIIHIVVEEYPPFVNAWTYEIYQRNCITQGLKDCQPEDIILISDADEIPHPKSIQNSTIDLDKIAAFGQWLFYYHLNQFCISSPLWAGTRVLPYRCMDDRTPQDIRLMDAPVLKAFRGWHFSFLGGIEKIREKIQAYAHQELNMPLYTDYQSIHRAVLSGKDIFNRGLFFRCVALDTYFPDYIIQNQDKYRVLIMVDKATDFPSLGYYEHSSVLLWARWYKWSYKWCGKINNKLKKIMKKLF